MIKIADSFLSKQGFQYFIQSLKTKLKQKANISDLPTKISDLENDEDYVDSEMVDSKITSAVSEITSFEYQIVDTLPSHGEKGAIYLIKHIHGTDDNYDEYIWVNDKFEKIGSTDIDLSEYAKKSEVDSSVGMINENISSLKQDLSTENEARKEADATLETSLNAEITNRTSSDDEIKAKLTTENEERTTSDNALKDSITEETKLRIKANSDLQFYIAAVDERVSTLTEELITEEETRENADVSLQSNIDDEITNRQTADNTLQTNIATEVQNRTTADSELSSKLTAETESREKADAELLTQISTIPKFSIEVVEVLPTADISDTTVYLVKTSETETGNLYTEYIHVNGAWEELGTQTVDLSDYYQKEETQELLAKKAEKVHSHVVADITDYEPYDDTEVRGLISAESTARAEADAKKVGYQEVQGNTLYMYSDDTKAVLLATLELPTAPVQDVQVAGASVVADGVANVPLATSNTTGVILGKNDAYNIGVSSTGSLYVSSRNLKYYQTNMGNIHAISKGTLENIKQNYVDSILCSTDESQALTTQQKINARNRIEAVGNSWELIESIELTTDTTGDNITRSAFPDGTPYELAECFIQITYPKGIDSSGADGYGRFIFYNTKETPLHSLPSACDKSTSLSAAMYTYIHAQGGKLGLCRYTKSAKMGSSLAWDIYSGYGVVTDFGNITAIKGAEKDTFPKGTIIDIYGIRT